MVSKIMISKSIEKGKIIRKTRLSESIYDFLAYAFLIGAFPFSSGLFFLQKLENGYNIVNPSVLLGISIFFGGLLLYSVINLNRLKRIKGIAKAQNQQAIKKVAKKHGWKLDSHNHRISIISLPWNWLSTNFGREIFIIYDQQDILINTTTYGQYQSKSPLHWFGNRKTEKIIKDSFEQEIKKMTNEGR